MQNELDYKSDDVTRYDEMRDEWLNFHNENPQVWELFCRFTRQIADRGFTSYSADAVIQRIRWETDQARVDCEKNFKINNNHIPFYARAFMNACPQYSGFFRTRHQISRDKNATDLPPLTPANFPYEANNNAMV